jgi:hypothetical protein
VRSFFLGPLGSRYQFGDSVELGLGKTGAFTTAQRLAHAQLRLHGWLAGVSGQVLHHLDGRGAGAPGQECPRSGARGA